MNKLSPLLDIESLRGTNGSPVLGGFTTEWTTNDRPTVDTMHDMRNLLRMLNKEG